MGEMIRRFKANEGREDDFEFISVQPPRQTEGMKIVFHGKMLYDANKMFDDEWRKTRDGEKEEYEVMHSAVVSAKKAHLERIKEAGDKGKPFVDDHDTKLIAVHDVFGAVRVPLSVDVEKIVHGK